MSERNGKKPEKPFLMQYDEAREAVAKAITEAKAVRGVPYVFIEEFLKNFLMQIGEYAQSERAASQRAYDQSCEEYIKATQEENQTGKEEKKG